MERVMEHADPVKPAVLQMYMRHPYPDYSSEEVQKIQLSQLDSYHFAGLDQFLPGARMIDVGCGTGRFIPLAKHFGVKEYVGFDQSTASLKRAEGVARSIGFKQATFVEGDLFKLPFPDASFDYVNCYGVLHHTSDPYRGFKEQVRVLKPGGFAAIFLYNKFGHWRHNIQKNKVSRLAGDDVEKRFEVAHRLYGKKPLEQMTPPEIAEFYDQFCHPHKSDHTLGELLRWFDEQGLDYWGSEPPLRFRDFIALAQQRADKRKQEPDLPGGRRGIAPRIFGKLPRVRTGGPPFRRPNVLNRFVWQAWFALKGARGRYSISAALCGRKRPY